MYEGRVENELFVKRSSLILFFSFNPSRYGVLNEIVHALLGHVQWRDTKIVLQAQETTKRLYYIMECL
jgi:hypothetical protein